MTAKENVTWHSTNENVATVNSSGVVTGVNEGVAEIIASTSEKKDKATVVVLENEESNFDVDDRVAPTSITLEPSEHTLLEFGVSKKLAIFIEPNNAITEVEWTTSDDSIVRFRDDLGGEGWITSWNTEGTATITATSKVDNSIKGTAIIHVRNG